MLVDHARKRRAEKRGDGKAPVTLEDDRLIDDDDGHAVLALDDECSMACTTRTRI